MHRKNNYKINDKVWFVVQTKGTKLKNTYTYVLESKIDSIDNDKIRCGRWILNKDEIFSSEQLAVKEAKRKIGEIND